MSERVTGSPWFTNARKVVFEPCETVAVSVGGGKPGGAPKVIQWSLRLPFVDCQKMEP